MNIEQIKFDEKGLVPSIIQDYYTKEVLTLAYMNKESLEITLRDKKTCFFSRSRQELWLKGETSGNYQHVVSVKYDCDADALLVEVKKMGLLAILVLRVAFLIHCLKHKIIAVLRLKKFMN